MISNLAFLRSSAAAAALLTFAAPVAQAQQSDQGAVDQVPATAESGDQPGRDAVVVTGTRIRRTDTNSVAPVTVFTTVDLDERGYNQAGEMLNQITSNVPSEPTPPFQGVFVFNAGRHSPNLFNLGAGRTLTLVNGRRMVTSSSGLGDRVVDSNVVPSGLIQRVDVVQAGGAAVYGSDAIAGVVNYILKEDFEGLSFGGSFGMSSRNDNERYSARMTAGTNFDDDRGNIAAHIEWSKTVPLFESDRPITSTSPRTVTNPLNTSTTDGQPPQVYIFDARGWTFNRNGVIFSSNSSNPSALVRNGGNALQFSADGQTIIPYDTGVIPNNSGTQAIGGQGIDYREISSLAAGVDRYSTAVIGHYDFADNLKLSGEFLLGHEEAEDPIGTQSILRFINGSALSGQGPFTFNRTNPYLTQQAINTLDAASSTFAGGGNLVLSRFMDVLPTRERYSETNTWRALVALEGDTNFLDRDFYWSLSASHGETTGENGGWAPYTTHLVAALDSVKLGSGQIVCRINADVSTTNDDPNCAPLNPFGNDTASPEATAYISAQTGSSFVNGQDSFLATLGGDVIDLPAGKAKFSLAFEKRYEGVKFDPFEADREGYLFSGIKSPRASGSYRTDELSTELLIPVVGGDFKLPFVENFELSGSYRWIDNSVAGEEKVWGTGQRWDVAYGVTLRASQSRNFRAPTLTQQFAPVSQSVTFIGQDPCDADRINAGSAPAIRRANCEAEWAANPGRLPLTGFQDPAENTSIVLVQTGGNPNLRNEISDTKTFGVVFQPDYIPGLVLSVDSIDVQLRDAIVSLTTTSFLAQCYDRSPQPADVCSTFTRNADGWVATGKSTTFNAGFLNYKGEIYNVNYRFDIGDVFAGGADLGMLDLGLEATHNKLYASGTGTAVSRSEGTTSSPDWRTRLDVRYSKGPLGVFYSIYHLPEAKSGYFDTIETVPYPNIASNTTHSLSMSYQLDNYTFRAGVNNLTDKMPSFPTRDYGNFYGRQYFVSLSGQY